MLGVAKQQAVLDRYNELAMNYWMRPPRRWPSFRTRIDAENLWELEATVGVASGCAALPAR